MISGFALTERAPAPSACRSDSSATWPMSIASSPSPNSSSASRMMDMRRRVVIACVALLGLAGGFPLRQGPETAVSAETLPSSLSDQAFWRLVTDFSEPNGYFRSDNFLSNEVEYQWVIPTLISTLGTGGGYLGVGPAQK